MRREEGIEFGIPRLTIKTVSLGWSSHKQKHSAAILTWGPCGGSTSLLLYCYSWWTFEQGGVAVVLPCGRGGAVHSGGHLLADRWDTPGKEVDQTSRRLKFNCVLFSRDGWYHHLSTAWARWQSPQARISHKTFLWNRTNIGGHGGQNLQVVTYAHTYYLCTTIGYKWINK